MLPYKRQQGYTKEVYYTWNPMGTADYFSGGESVWTVVVTGGNLLMVSVLFVLSKILDRTLFSLLLREEEIDFSFTKGCFKVNIITSYIYLVSIMKI